MSEYMKIESRTSPIFVRFLFASKLASIINCDDLQSIDLFVCQDACHNFFCFLGEFYESGTQSVEEKKITETLNDKSFLSC